jgi:hypothetical protein
VGPSWNAPEDELLRAAGRSEPSKSTVVWRWEGRKGPLAEDMGVEVPETHVSAPPDTWHRREVCQLALGQRFCRVIPNNPRNAGMHKTVDFFSLTDERRRCVRRLYSFGREEPNRDQVTC